MAFSRCGIGGARRARLPASRTGNSFLRDFTERGADYAIEAIRTRRRRPCDVIRLNHAGGTLFYINTLNIGFARMSLR